MSEKSLRGVGANEPCPCGSGKKHIECCLDGPNKWVVDEDGNTIRLKSLHSGPSAEDVPVEKIPLLRLTVEDGRLIYTKSVSMSRIAGFPSDMIRLMISSIEVEKQQTSMETFNAFLERTQEFDDDVADSDDIEEGVYDLLIVAIDGDGNPLGLGGQRVSEYLSEESLLGLIGALEEIKTDLMLCLTMNCIMNGMMGTVDNL